MKLFREFVLLTFLAVAYSLDNFNRPPSGFRVPSQLMDEYGYDGFLTKIPWESFSNFERSWTSMLNPRVPDATSAQLNTFFTKLLRAKDNHHEAMDSITSMCSYSQTSLSYLPENLSVDRANKGLTHIMEKFTESKTHLYDMKENLLAAADIINAIEPYRPEVSNVRTFLITDFNDGTVQLETLGAPYENPEDLNKLLVELSRVPREYYSSNSPVSINFGTVLRWRAVGSGRNSKAPTHAAPTENKLTAFFSRLNGIKSDLNLAIMNLDAFIIQLEGTLSSPALVNEPPTPQQLAPFLNKCERYNPVF